MPSKRVNSIKEKLVTVNDTFNVNMYDNGFMLEITGRNKNQDYVTAKIVCNNPDELITTIKEAIEMERTD